MITVGCAGINLYAKLRPDEPMTSVSCAESAREKYYHIITKALRRSDSCPTHSGFGGAVSESRQEVDPILFPCRHWPSKNRACLLFPNPNYHRPLFDSM